MKPYIELAKIPPQAVDVEMSVLGTILMDNNAMVEVGDLFRVEAFYKECNQIVAGAINTLYTNDKPIDMLTVAEQLIKDGKLEEVGGAYYISELTQKAVNSEHIKEHMLIVIDKYLGREAIRAGAEMSLKGYDDTVDNIDLLEQTISELETISSNIFKSGAPTLQTQLNTYNEEINKRAAMYASGVYTGIRTPISYLTQITRGWQPSDLIIIAGRPSQGKTAFLIQCALSACEADKSVMIFSLEMSYIQLLNRIYQNMGLSEDNVKDGNMNEQEWARYYQITNIIQTLKLHIDDTSGIGVNYIKSECRKKKRKAGLDLVLIDYLQLMEMKATAQNRHLGLSEITKALKQLAKELNIPVILLSQLNRSVESRVGSKRPQLSDLKESGAIEEDADVVGFIYRPMYYGFENDDAGNSTIGVMEIIIKKNRNGVPNKTVFAKHNETITKISDPENDFKTTPTKSFHDTERDLEIF